MQTARGVEHVDVIAAECGLLFGAAGDVDGFLARNDRQGVDADLGAEDRQLVLRRRAVDVEGGHEHALAVLLGQALGEFRGRRGFTAALQTDHQDGRGRVVDFQLTGFVIVTGKHVFQLVMDDLDDLLAGRDGFGDRLASGLLAHGFDKIACHGKGDVGLQQGHAHLAERGFDVVLGKRTLFGETIKDAREAFGQIFKHSLGSFALFHLTHIGPLQMQFDPHGRNSLVGGDPDMCRTGKLTRSGCCACICWRPLLESMGFGR